MKNTTSLYNISRNCQSYSIGSNQMSSKICQKTSFVATIKLLTKNQTTNKRRIISQPNTNIK